MEYLWGHTFTLLLLLTRGEGQSPPYLTDNSGETIIVSEATPIGSVLRTLTATDDDGDDVTFRYPDYDTPSKDLIVINQTSFGSVAEAQLILSQDLDRDHTSEVRKLHVIMQDNSSNTFQIIVVIDLYITDVNDERPVFKNLPYRLDLREDHPNMTIVYRNITAHDPDNGLGGRISYYLQPDTQSTQDAISFLATFSIDNVTGAVTLTRSLDYEQMQVYQFIVYAEDGYGFNTTEVLTIRILDVQDTPPLFLGTPYVVTITENIPVGTHFYTVRSLDGDRGVPNTLQFKFMDGPCTSLFHIDNSTGEVTVSNVIDRDGGEIMERGGVCDLQILVVEIEANFPQLGPTTAMTSLNIYIGDVNDNQPKFNMTSYRAYIDNTALLNYPIQFENRTDMVIEDLDQGSSGILELVLRSQDGDLNYDFEPIPSVIASQGRPIIALKSPDLLLTRDEIILYIYAVERDTEEKFSASAILTIHVLPVATTTVSTTTLQTTTPVNLDPFIPSVLGAVLAFILLVWGSVITFCYCYHYRRKNTNKVVPCNSTNGNHSNGIITRSESPIRGHPPPTRNNQHLLPPVLPSKRKENGEIPA